jgi:hypothetical protein
VRNVEEAHALAHGAVLLEDARVLDRHLPAAEVDHARAELLVERVERSPLEHGGGCGGAHREWEGSTPDRGSRKP